MKVTLPESIEDITLGQYQDYIKLSDKLEAKEITERDFINSKIALFSGIDKSLIDDIYHRDLEYLKSHIDTALNEDSPFVNRFFLDGVEFGFIENLDNISSAEYFDMSSYGTDVETLHKLMAVLFRPIKKKDKTGNYKIKKYKGSVKYGDLMKEMPLSIVNGALVFFWNLSKELEIYIQKFTIQQQQRVEELQTTLSNGDGIAQSMN